MFFCQVVATIIAGTVQLGVQAWMFTNIDGMCDADQADGFICPSTQVFGTASIIWGVIGPARQFSRQCLSTVSSAGFMACMMNTSVNRLSAPLCISMTHVAGEAARR